MAAVRRSRARRGAAPDGPRLVPTLTTVSPLEQASVAHKRAVENLVLARSVRQHKDVSRPVRSVASEAVATAETEVRAALRNLEQTFFKETGVNMYMFVGRLDQVGQQLVGSGGPVRG